MAVTDWFIGTTSLPAKLIVITQNWDFPSICTLFWQSIRLNKVLAKPAHTDWTRTLLQSENLSKHFNTINSMRTACQLKYQLDGQQQGVRGDTLQVLLNKVLSCSTKGIKFPNVICECRTQMRHRNTSTNARTDKKRSGSAGKHCIAYFNQGKIALKNIVNNNRQRRHLNVPANMWRQR